MNGIERAIGKLEEHAEWSKDQLKILNDKMDSMLAFRWKIYGATVVIAAVSSLVFQIAIAIIGRGFK